jgi:hypothetical protein
MKYKVPINIKGMFGFNVGLFILSLILGESAALAASVIIFVILSVSIHILEAIHDIGAMPDINREE